MTKFQKKYNRFSSSYKKKLSGSIILKQCIKERKSWYFVNRLAAVSYKVWETQFNRIIALSVDYLYRPNLPVIPKPFAPYGNLSQETRVGALLGKSLSIAKCVLTSYFSPDVFSNYPFHRDTLWYWIWPKKTGWE